MMNNSPKHGKSPLFITNRLGTCLALRLSLQGSFKNGVVVV